MTRRKLKERQIYGENKNKAGLTTVRHLANQRQLNYCSIHC